MKYFMIVVACLVLTACSRDSVEDVVYVVVDEAVEEAPHIGLVLQPRIEDVIEIGLDMSGEVEIDWSRLGDATLYIPPPEIPEPTPTPTPTPTPVPTPVLPNSTEDPLRYEYTPSFALPQQTPAEIHILFPTAPPDTFDDESEE